MLEAAGWDPTAEAARSALNRIVAFQETVSKHSMRTFPTFVLNDGAIAYRDLSPRSRNVTFDFLWRSVTLHAEINAAERAAGFPSARAVLAVGFRARRFVDYSQRLSTHEGLRIKEKLASGSIDPEQAINHALLARHHSDSTPELQHNYAMTKAYLVDSAGSKAGFGGPRLFVDMNIFVADQPKWAKFSETLDWSGRGMKGIFAAIDSLNISHARRTQFQGVRDAFEIAQALSPNPEILNIIRSSRLGNLRRPKLE